MSDRRELKLLGRIIGTYTGWDGDPGDSVWFYDFIPAEGINLKPTDQLMFLEIEGKFQTINEAGEVIEEWDAIETLKDVPKA